MVPYALVHPINPMRSNTNIPIGSKRYQRSPSQWFECSNNGIYAKINLKYSPFNQGLCFVTTNVPTTAYPCFWTDFLRELSTFTDIQPCQHQAG